MRRLFPLALGLGCVQSYLPTVATAPGSDELIFSAAAIETKADTVRYLWGSNSIALWKRLGAKGDWLIHGEVIASSYATMLFLLPISSSAVGLAKAWEFKDGYLFVGLDDFYAILGNSLVPYLGMSLKRPGARLWATARPGYLVFLLEPTDYRPYPAAQAGLTLGDEEGVGFFAGFEIQDTATLWRGGFYLFEAVK